MAELRKVNESTLALARKAKGKLPKKPKKPRQSSSLATMEAYIVRHNAWCEKITNLANSVKKRDSLKKKIFG